MIEIEFKPARMMSRDIVVLHGAEELALLDRAVFRERATLRLAGDEYGLRARGFTSGCIELEREGALVASARRAFAFGTRWDVALEPGAFEGDGGPWELRRTGIFTSALQLVEAAGPGGTGPGGTGPGGMGPRVGTITPRGFFARGCVVGVEESVPPPIAVFVGYLWIVLRERAQSSAD